MRHLVTIWREPDIAEAVAEVTSIYKNVYQDIADRINEVFQMTGHHRDAVQVSLFNIPIYCAKSKLTHLKNM